MGEHRTASGLSYTRAGQGPSVVVVHGWCCDRSSLTAQLDHLCGNHMVLAPDLRGHGGSAQAGGPAQRVSDDRRFAISDFADDVAEVARDAGLCSPVIIGHSLGGLVALELAARGAASAAVLLDPAPMLDGPAKAYFGRSWPAVATDADGSWRRRFAERIMLPTDRVRRAEILAGVASSDPAVAAAAMRGMADYDAAAALSAVTVPILVVSAARPEDMVPVRERCPHLVTGQVVGAGHFLQIEVPDQVNAMIDRFLTLLQ